MADKPTPADDGGIAEDEPIRDDAGDETDARTRRRLELSPVMTAAAVGGLSAAGIAVAVILGRRFLKRRQERTGD